MSKRIQRKRNRGWRMPENTKYCGRPTMWGNPFKEVGDIVYVDAGHRRKVLDRWVYYGSVSETGGAAKIFHDLLMDLNSRPVAPEIYNRFRLMRDRIFDLRGFDLACFCPLHSKCHVDSLLLLANY